MGQHHVPSGHISLGWRLLLTVRAHVHTAILQRHSHIASRDTLMVNSNSQILKCRRDVLHERDGIMFRR
jgi:hypothetical protein